MGERVVYHIIRLYCIRYCEFGIFQYLFNLNTSVGFSFQEACLKLHVLSYCQMYSRPP